MPEQPNKLTRQQRREMERKGVLPKEPPSSSEHVLQLQSISWSGPLPPPDALRQYGFIKDGPERILRMAEQQARHRQKIENRDSLTEGFQRMFGPVAALILGLGGIGGAVYLLDQGHGIGGFATLIGTLAILVGAMQGTKKPSEKDNAGAGQGELFRDGG